MGKYLDRLTGWDHVTTKSLVALLIALTIIYGIILWGQGARDSNQDGILMRIEKICLIPCSSPDCFPQRTRGKRSTPCNVPCAITIWHLSHLILHMIIGYFFNIWVSLTVGLGFEMHEYINLDCADVLDPLVNTLGCLLGAYIKSEGII